MKMIQRTVDFMSYLNRFRLFLALIFETFESFPSKNVKGGHGHIEPYYIIIYSNIFI